MLYQDLKLNIKYLSNLHILLLLVITFISPHHNYCIIWYPHLPSLSSLLSLCSSLSLPLSYPFPSPQNFTSPTGGDWEFICLVLSYIYIIIHTYIQYILYLFVGCMFYSWGERERERKTDKTPNWLARNSLQYHNMYQSRWEIIPWPPLNHKTFFFFFFLHFHPISLLYLVRFSSNPPPNQTIQHEVQHMYIHREDKNWVCHKWKGCMYITYQDVQQDLNKKKKRIWIRLS